MTQTYIGQIVMFAGNFAPKNWAFCNGQTMYVTQSSALFSILGTTYGGNGTQTFLLPDFRGRVAVSQGQGAGLSTYTLGEQTGTETVTLLTEQMPAHNHIVNADASPGSQVSPAVGNLAETANISKSPSATQNTYTTGTLGQPTSLNPNTLQYTGGNKSHANIQPTLAVNYIICLFGIYPSRN